jgi:hypothetical protein
MNEGFSQMASMLANAALEQTRSCTASIYESLPNVMHIDFEGSSRDL